MGIVAVRTAVIYAVLVAAMRVMGKRQLGDWQPSELVITLLVADMAAVAMEDTGAPLFSGLIPIVVLVSLELLLSGASLKIPFLERLLGGRPVMLINDGHLDQKAMKKLRLSLDDVLSALRQQGVFDLQDVQYAVAEIGGQMSLSLKPAARPVTCEDLNITAVAEDIPFLVVSDGKISKTGLALCQKSEAWLQRTLHTQKCGLQDVFLLTADRGGHIYLLKKDDAL